MQVIKVFPSSAIQFAVSGQGLASLGGGLATSCACSSSGGCACPSSCPHAASDHAHAFVCQVYDACKDVMLAFSGPGGLSMHAWHAGAAASWRHLLLRLLPLLRRWPLQACALLMRSSSCPRRCHARGTARRRERPERSGEDGSGPGGWRHGVHSNLPSGGAQVRVCRGRCFAASAGVEVGSAGLSRGWRRHPVNKVWLAAESRLLLPSRVAQDASVGGTGRRRQQLPVDRAQHAGRCGRRWVPCTTAGVACRQCVRPSLIFGMPCLA